MVTATLSKHNALGIYPRSQVFINRAQLIKGTPALVESEAAEHLWVTKDEIGEYLGETMGVYLKHML